MRTHSIDPSRSTQHSDQELLARYHEDGDVDAREQIVARFIPFARELALRYRYTDEPFDDLVQVASMGLLKAVDRFEPGRGIKFTSYAAPTILGELKRHFRDKGWALHVPRELQERVLAVGRETETLSKRLGRSPTPREVAGGLGRSVEDVLAAKEAAGSYQLSSLDAPVSRQADEPAALVELIGSSDNGFDLVEEREEIAASWQTLPELEQRVLGLRFVHDLTQREIGERLGYSQMHVSRLLRRALSRMEASLVAAA
ncbi:MAG: SigB/SigF/SigG family RNA polymerase sigma factor [Thermoleophilaceae bacterium]